jgi:hypothetical protein
MQKKFMDYYFGGINMRQLYFALLAIFVVDICGILLSQIQFLFFSLVGIWLLYRHIDYNYKILKNQLLLA